MNLSINPNRKRPFGWAYTLEPKGHEASSASSKDLITLAVANQTFNVSRETLKRAISEGRIKSYRPPDGKDNMPHIVSESEVAKLYPRRN